MRMLLLANYYFAFFLDVCKMTNANKSKKIPAKLLFESPVFGSLLASGWFLEIQGLFSLQLISLLSGI